MTLGKRINFSQRESDNTRVEAAIVSFVRQDSFLNNYKKM